MRFVILFFIYFSIVSCKNVTIEINSNKTSNPMVESNKSVLGATEGGTVLPSSHSLPNISGLVIGKNSVKPRKGADYNSSNEETTLSATGIFLPVKSETLKNDSLVPNRESLQNQSSAAVTHSVNETEVSSLNKTTAKETNDTITHKKPLVLSYEALANASRTAENDLVLRTDNLSPKTIISDQVHSPIESKLASEKIHPTQSSRHPDMIMPVVITMLVVPMFAVLGYMVLRRGREAWKNRHYKRMDFLLDGMYND